MTEGIVLDVPGWRRLHLTALVLDVNGVLALDGHLLPAVPGRIAELRRVLAVYLLSADTHGRLDEVAAALEIEARRLRPGGEAEQKAEFVRNLGPDSIAAIGNGANDVGMLREAGLGIAVLGHEGAAVVALQAADVLVGSVHEALDLLLRPARLVATLRR